MLLKTRVGLLLNHMHASQVQHCLVKAAYLEAALMHPFQGWTGLVDLPGLPHGTVQQWWILPGPTPGKLIQCTSFNCEMPVDAWHSLWRCRDQEVIPVGFAEAVQP